MVNGASGTYHYFISYWFMDPSGRSGFGRRGVWVNELIKDLVALDGIEEQIQADIVAQCVVVVGFQLLDWRSL